MNEKTLKKNLALSPKKILNYQTPTDLFEQELNKVLHLVLQITVSFSFDNLVFLSFAKCTVLERRDKSQYLDEEQGKILRMATLIYKS